MTVGIPGALGSSQHDHIAEGGKAWNQLTNQLTFTRSGNEVGNFDPASVNCSSPSSWPGNAVHWRTNVPGIAKTYACADVANDVMGNFQIAIDSGEQWYWGDGDVPSGEYDVQSATTHEFGHASGGWSEVYTPYGHFDKDVNAALCADNVPNASYLTMCVSLRNGRKDGRSLEPHDVDTFLTAY